MKQISEAFGKRLKDTGVTRIQWVALYYISREEPISPRELSERLGVAESSGKRLLDRMERDGLIIRKKSPSDKRVLLVTLTDSGRVLFQKLLPYGENFNNDLIRGIEERELMIFEKVLDKMLNNISKDPVE